MTTDLDKSGQNYQQSKVYLGPSLGWQQVRVVPQTIITTGGTHTLEPDASAVLVNVAALVTINLPDVTTWMHQPGAKPTPSLERSILIKDFGGNAGTFAITVVPFAGQTIDDGGSVILGDNHQVLSFWPLNDLSGWYIEEGGASGTDGTDGTDGSLIFVEASAPSVIGVPEGSIWIDQDSTDVDLYELIGGVWTDTGTNLKGPPGGTPGGNDTEAQYNNLGSFAGAPKLRYNNTLNVVRVSIDDGTRGGGIYANLDNPRAIADPNYSRAYEFGTRWFAPIDLNVGFTTAITMAIPSTIWDGQNFYGDGTTSKITFTNLSVSCDAYGSGQRIMTQQVMRAFGMGDAALESRRIEFSCGNTAGDEGVGFSLVNHLYQKESLTQNEITAIPTQATINTTTTAIITGDKDEQTVPVVSSAGVIVGQWVIAEQNVPAGPVNIDAVLITAVPDATHIRGIFRANHPNGATITPALVLNVGGANFMGEQRVLVNRSGTSYTTGTVASISANEFIGSGTAWTANMVGGNLMNVGAVCLTNDDYTGTPFGTGSSALHSWYQIRTFTDATHFTIHTWSVAGDTSYRGNGVGAGAYTILPAARILKIPDNQTLVCETSTHTWTVGDIVECAICPYPDFSAWQTHVGAWTPGGTYRYFSKVANTGSRKIETGHYLGVYGSGLCTGLNGSSDNAWGTGFMLQSCDVGLRVVGNIPAHCSIMLPISSMGGDNTDQSGAIVWGSQTTKAAVAGIVPQIRPRVDAGVGTALDIIGCGSGGNGTASFIGASWGINTSPNTPAGANLLTWQGQFKVGAYTFANIATAAANLVGSMVTVTDSTTAVVGATITGGGANTVLAWCNGTAWKVAAS